jgi:hypothetical protein
LCQIVWAMLDTKLQSLEKQEKITAEQAAELRRYATQEEESSYPTLGERIKLFSSVDEALALLKQKRHSLLEIARSPNSPDEVFFVLRLKSGDVSPTKRFGQPRTWLLLGIALGAALNLMVQTLWPKSKPAESSKPVMIYPTSQE